MSDRYLRYVLYSRPIESRYTEFEIPKRKSGTRTIAAPDAALKAIQRRLLAAIAEIIEPSSIACGFVPGRSIADHAATHRRRRWVVIADLHEYFPSINFGRVRGAFLAAPFNLSPEVATCIAQLCCYKNALPQGAPTSPAIANLVSVALDRRLKKLASAAECSVSRYADDICFSTNRRDLSPLVAKAIGSNSWAPSDELLDAIRKSGFALNAKKFRVMHRRDQQMVTGLIVNRRPSMPRAWRRQLRVLLHLASKHGGARALEVAKAWDTDSTSLARASDLNRVVAGKAGILKWLDDRFGGSNNSALLRGYPRMRSVLPRDRWPRIVRLMTEGDSDAAHISAAIRWFQLRGKFSEVRVEVKNFRGDKGDNELMITLQRLAVTDVDQLTVGIFDCDSPRLMTTHSLVAGGYRRLGPNVYALCLARPAWLSDEQFCIEHLYRREDATRITRDGRRLFFVEEFDPSSGLHHSGAFRRTEPKATAKVVGTRVVRVSDNASVLLSKRSFAEMIEKGEFPFDDVAFEGFAPTFEALRRIHDEAVRGRKI